MIEEHVSQLKRRLIDNLPYVCKAKYVDWCLQRSTREARRRLAGSARLSVLIDNSTLRYAKTHKTVGVKQQLYWPPDGESSEILVPCRAPIVFGDNHREVNENIPYLPGIAHLARMGMLKLMTSRELKSEQLHHPVGAARGQKGWFDFWLFEGIDIDSVDGYESIKFDLEYFRDNPTINEVIYSTDIDPFDVHPDNMSNMNRRLSQSSDSIYRDLAKLLPKKSNFDAWHIRTAEVHGLFCFLTMDFKLRGAIEKNRKKESIASLCTKVMTPAEFGRCVGLSPIDPYICELAEQDAMKSSARLRKFRLPM